MRQKSGPEKQPAEDAIRSIGARHVDTFQLKRRFASYWKGCAGSERAASDGRLRLIKSRLRFCDHRRCRGHREIG